MPAGVDSAWAARLEAARASHDIQRYDRVVAQLEAAAEDEDSPPAEVFFLLGDAYTNLGQLGEAEETLSRGLDLYPSQVSLQSTLARLYFVRGRMALLDGSRQEAREAFTQALATAPQDRDIRKDIAGAYTEIARRLRQRGDPGSAAEVFQESLEVDPDNPVLIRNLADSLAEAGRPAAALDFYRLFLDYYDGDARMYSDMAKLSEALGRTDEAMNYRRLSEDALRTASVADTRRTGPPPPENLPMAVPEQGDGEAEAPVSDTREYREEARRLVAGASSAPAASGILLKAGEQALEIREYPRAIALLREALRLAPRNRRAALRLAEVYQKNRQPQRASAVYRDWIRQNPGDETVMFMLARSHVTEGRPADGIPYLQALAADASLSLQVRIPALNWLGIARAQMGELDRAREAWEDLIALQPSHANAHYNLGQMYEKQELFPQAISAFEKAVEYGDQDPDYLRYLHRLGLAYRQNGQVDSAIQMWRKLIGVAPPASPYRKKAAQLLSQYEGSGVPPLASRRGTSPDGADIDPSLSAARDALRRGDLLEAEKGFKSVLSSLSAEDNDDRAAEAHAGLGRVLLARRDARAALVSLARAGALRPGDPAIEFHLARAEASAGLVSDAVRRYLAIRPPASSYQQMRLQVAQDLEALDHIDDAVLVLEGLIDRNPTTAIADMARRRLETLSKRLLAPIPTRRLNQESNENRARQLAHADLLDAGVRLDRNGRYVIAGKKSTPSPRKSGAMPRLTVAEEADGRGDPRLGRATSLLRAGNYREAYALFSALAREYPSLGQAQMGAGDAAFGLGKQERALAHYRRAVKANPRAGVTYFKMADLFRARGDRKAEKGIYEEMLSAGVRGDLARQAAFRLEELSP